MHVKRSLVVPVDGRLKRNRGAESAIRGWSRGTLPLGEQRLLGTDEVLVLASVAGSLFGDLLLLSSGSGWHERLALRRAE
jgi:hypothetical protein